MARLCIRILANNHPTDPLLDMLRTQIGDVVSIQEDGHVWSQGELRCGQYRFLDIPGVPQADLISLIESVFDAKDESVLIRVRARTLNAAVLMSPAWKTRTTATKAQLDALTVARP